MYRIDFNKLRFLICDDNPQMRRHPADAVAFVRAREAMRPKTARPALEMYTHYVPISSSPIGSMPIFDGLELAQIIRSRNPRAIPTRRSSC